MNDGWTDERMDDFRDEVNRRFDGFDRQFDRIDQRFLQVDKQFDKVDQRFLEVDKRFDKVDYELARLNGRFDGLYRATYLVGGGIVAALIGVIVQL